jgi:hypothetical protein
MTTASAEQAGLREDATGANGKKAPFCVVHSLRTDDDCRTEKRPMTDDQQTTIALHFNACINNRISLGWRHCRPMITRSLRANTAVR